jgi:hypothetical protein
VPFPHDFTVTPNSVIYGVETYEGGEETLGFGAAAMTTGPLPLTDYLEPIYQEFADNVRDAVLAHLPAGRRGRTFRTLMLGGEVLGQEPGELYPLAEN